MAEDDFWDIDPDLDDLDPAWSASDQANPPESFGSDLTVRMASMPNRPTGLENVWSRVRELLEIPAESWPADKSVRVEAEFAPALSALRVIVGKN